MNFVVNFIRFPAIKEFEDWLSFDKVKVKIKVAPFVWPMVYYN